MHQTKKLLKHQRHKMFPPSIYFQTASSLAALNRAVSWNDSLKVDRCVSKIWKKCLLFCFLIRTISVQVWNCVIEIYLMNWELWRFKYWVIPSQKWRYISLSRRKGATMIGAFEDHLSFFSAWWTYIVSFSWWYYWVFEPSMLRVHQINFDYIMPYLYRNCSNKKTKYQTFFPIFRYASVHF